MSDDAPIAFKSDGSPVYDNVPTVVIMLAAPSSIVSEELKFVVIRRSTEPGKDKLALPGGHHMRGETWQEAGCRELLEETGWRADPRRVVQLGHVITDEYGKNLVFGIAWGCLPPELDWEPDGEAQEVVLLTRPGDAEEWAFLTHYASFCAVLLKTLEFKIQQAADAVS